MTDDLDNAIRENAQGPAEAHGDSGGMTQHGLTYKALVIEDDPQAVDMIEDVLAALSHEYDLAASLLRARKLVKTNEYSYVLLDIEFPARSSQGTPRIQNAENFLDDLAAAKGDGERRGS